LNSANCWSTDIHADDPLAEATRMLKQAQELGRVLDTRVLDLTNEVNEVMRRYKGPLGHHSPSRARRDSVRAGAASWSTARPA
jgi:hypothetical protein